MPLIKIADMPFFIIYLATDVIEIEKKKEYFFYTRYFLSFSIKLDVSGSIPRQQEQKGSFLLRL